MMRTLAAFLVLLAIAAAAVVAGHVAQSRVERALANKCARASDGTRDAIAECFHRYGVNQQ
jgi:hypothetical protein